MWSGLDSLNETKLSFGAGLDFNSAVKFNANDRENDNDGDEPYYTFSTSNWPKHND